MSRFRTLAAIAVFVSTPLSAVAAPLARLVVIVSIDGLRPDALPKAPTPNLDALCRRGAFSWTAQTVVPSITLVAHTSMLTGVLPKQHGITTDLTTNRLTAETCLQLAKRAGRPTSMIVGKDKLKRIAKPGTIDYYKYSGYWAKDVAADAVKHLAKQHTGIMFLHLPDPDSLGHQTGWMSQRYLNSVSDCDTALGRVLAALRERGLYDHTLLIVTADHGGHRKVHGTKAATDMTIPWICAGPGVTRNHQIRQSLHIYDTAATVLFALGLPSPRDWSGKAVREAFAAGLGDVAAER